MRTTILITHKLSNLKIADKIVVLQDGQVVETGTYEELIEQNGAFKKLIAIQSQSELGDNEFVERSHKRTL